MKNQYFKHCLSLLSVFIVLIALANPINADTSNTHDSSDHVTGITIIEIADTYARFSATQNESIKEISIQWQVREDGEWIDIPNATNWELNFENLSPETQYTIRTKTSIPTEPSPSHEVYYVDGELYVWETGTSSTEPSPSYEVHYIDGEKYIWETGTSSTEPSSSDGVHNAEGGLYVWETDTSSTEPSSSDGVHHAEGGLYVWETDTSSTEPSSSDGVYYAEGELYVSEEVTPITLPESPKDSSSNGDMYLDESGLIYEWTDRDNTPPEPMIPDLDPISFSVSLTFKTLPKITITSPLSEEKLVVESEPVSSETDINKQTITDELIETPPKETLVLSNDASNPSIKESNMIELDEDTDQQGEPTLTPVEAPLEANTQSLLPSAGLSTGYLPLILCVVGSFFIGIWYFMNRKSRS